MLIGELKEQCKDKGRIFEKGRVFLIEQHSTQHADFLTISWLLHELQSQKRVSLVAFRQNYAHYLSLSKKLGKSIQPYLKTKQLKYIQCFESEFNCSQLPLTQSSPNSFMLPPTLVSRIKLEQLMKKSQMFQNNSTVVVDAVSFVGSEVVFKLYEEAMDKNCKIILAGVMEGDSIAKVFRPQTDVYIKLEIDVGNQGKFKLITQNNQINLHWKYLQGKFQLTQYIKI